MNKLQVEKFFKDKENTPCPLTDLLINAGYRQYSGGYISYAKQCGVENPTQYWHLLISWCARSKDDAKFTRSIQCGELLVWMAEVSGAVDNEKLRELVELIIGKYLYNRKEGNRIIQDVSFNKIVEVVENAF